MFHPTFKIITLLVGILLYTVTFAADGVDKANIDQDVYPLKQLTLSRSSLGQVSGWAEKIDALLPDLKQKYHVTIDLSGVDTLTLCNLSKFLHQLTLKQDVLSRIANLTLINGTSFRFNGIKEGLINMVKQNPSMGLAYLHTGKQTPSSPTRTLNSLAIIRGCALMTPSPGAFVLQPVEEGGEQADSLIREGFSQAIQKYEKAKKIDDLRSAFLGVENRNGFGSWPPFEIMDKDQVAEIYCDDIASFKPTGKTKPVFIILSGMSGYNIKDLYNLCLAQPSIKAVKFVDSALHPEDLEQILPLIGSQLMMLEISGAFGEFNDKVVWSKVEEFLASKDQSALINYFLFKDSSKVLETNQKVMSIITNYVKVINNGEDH